MGAEAQGQGGRCWQGHRDWDTGLAVCQGQGWGRSRGDGEQQGIGVRVGAAEGMMGTSRAVWTALGRGDRYGRDPGDRAGTGC